jgi:peptidoglycan/LPS O-acetylase OafA/YrhL
MLSQKAILDRLTRITSTGRYVREIHSLRFIAITFVVVMHISNYVGLEYESRFLIDPVQSSLMAFLHKFGKGVELFFAISGFVLGLPFASAYLRGDKPVSLRKYYWRRVTRLEPPYIIVMTALALFLAIAKRQAIVSIAQHLLASLLYCHGFIYGYNNTISYVAWSLEVEVQFYMLMPLIAAVYSIRKRHTRLMVWVSLAIAAILLQVFLKAPDPIMARLPFSLVWYLQYFCCGLFLADIYVDRGYNWGTQSFGWDIVSLVGWPALFLSWQFPKVSLVTFPVFIVLLYYCAFKGQLTNRFMRSSWIAAIGGMCYTIYLLHMPVIGLFGNAFRWLVISQSYPATFIAQCIVLTGPILVVCGVYFLLIEKPCMNPQWPQRLRARFARNLHPTTHNLQPTTLRQ